MTPSTPEWARNLVDLNQLDGPICHGYQFGCRCERCRDRSLRAKLYTDRGAPDPHGRAKRESEDYFLRKWAYDKQTPPRPLRELCAL